MPPTDEDIAWFKSTFHPIPRPVLPDDCIEYSIYIISSDYSQKNGADLRLKYRDVQKYVSELQRQWLKSYIWQRQGFSLELSKADGMSFLTGRCEYGDSIEDEWVIVWLLREVSKKFSNLWIKVTDSDGEFLLIEASGTLPTWLEPEVAENRVWINDGKLKIIKPPNSTRSTKRTQEKLNFEQAREIIVEKPSRIMHSISMEEEAFYRLRNYPAQIEGNMHYALVTIPRKLAFLLKQKASFIAPAVEAFYLRDSISLKPLKSKEYASRLTFQMSDLVTVSIKFPRVAFAQLKSQDFATPAVYQDGMPLQTDATGYKRAEIGMKVTTGFEMLIGDSQHQDKPAVREMKLLLDDIETGDEKLPSDDDIDSWEKREDDEKWLDISFEDLEQELKGQKDPGPRGKKPNFGDKAAQENLQRLVKQFEDFMNDDRAGLDGAEFFDDDTDDALEEDDEDDSDTGEDKDLSFDEDEFTRMMQEMMGMPPEVMKEIMTGKLGPGSREQATASMSKDMVQGRRDVEQLDTSNSESEENSMPDIMKQMEAELRATGVLNLDPPTKKKTVSRRTIKGKAPEENPRDDDDVSSSGDDIIENEIDINLAKNLLESFKSQSGLAGPSGNLMGLMGTNLPRDEGTNDPESSENRTGE